MTESPFYAQIIQAASHGNTRLFRQQSAMAWAGKILSRSQTSITLLHPRAIHMGVTGMADLGGVTSVIITPDMVGQRIGVDVQIEVKFERRKSTVEQADYIRIMQSLGVRAGIARSVEDAQRIIAGM